MDEQGRSGGLEIGTALDMLDLPMFAACVLLLGVAACTPGNHVETAPSTQVVTVPAPVVMEMPGETGTHDYAPGDFLYIPGRMSHFGGARGMTVIQLHGEGPFAINLGSAK